MVFLSKPLELPAPILNALLERCWDVDDDDDDGNVAAFDAEGRTTLALEATTVVEQPAAKGDGLREGLTEKFVCANLCFKPCNVDGLCCNAAPKYGLDGLCGTLDAGLVVELPLFVVVSLLPRGVVGRKTANAVG
uniref:Uncharacterized protein n=1 Tax=Romanomermis culicivorax TaxID=13658 RepID=A0A915IL91_ROMCU